MDMLDAAKQAMVPPHFEISVMADPSGAFTTAAGMIAVVEKHLRAAGREPRRAGEVAVFGGTGPVGRIAALIAAQAGAKVSLVGYDGLQRVTATCDQFGERFGVAMAPADGSDEAGKLAVIADAEVILAAGRAGTQILSTAQLATAKQLRVALDVNAVPPAGLEGVDAFADGTPIDGTAASGSARSRSATSSSRPSTSCWPRCATPSPAAISASPRRSRRLGGMPPPEPVLICALSGRALAQAARAAGFAPIVLDAFGDLDTRAAASAWQRVPVDRQLALPRGRAPGRGARVWRRRPSRWSGAPGSSASPALLAELAAGRELWAIRPAVGARGEGPAGLRRQRRACWGSPIPKCASTPPTDPSGWLCKRAGAPAAAMSAGPGGGRRAGAAGTGSGGRAGEPVSALVVGNGRDARCSPSASRSARRGRAAVPLRRRAGASQPRPAAARDRLERGRERPWPSTTACEGLASVDALVAGDSVTVLELNPRPGASLDAYRRGARRRSVRVRMSMPAAGGSLPEPCSMRRCAGSLIVYADRMRLGFPMRFAWPDWAADRSPAGTRHPGGGPICTVLAKADDRSRPELCC